MIPSRVERFAARIEGRVQGVGFRAFVVARARALGLSGSVKNLVGGGVWVEAEGSRDKLNLLLAELRRGPRASSVEHVSVTWHEPTGDRGFDIGWS